MNGKKRLTKMEYTILLAKQKEGGYTAQCLEVPGAISQGETKEEAKKNVKEALSLVLQVLREKDEKENFFEIAKKIRKITFASHRYFNNS